MIPLALIWIGTWLSCLYTARGGPFAQRGWVILMLILVSLLAPLQTIWPGGRESNVANIWYAAAIAMQINASRQIGKNGAFFILSTSYVAARLVGFAALMMAGTAMVPAAPDSLEFAKAEAHFVPELRIAVSSLCAFVAASGVVALGYSLSKLRVSVVTFVLSVVVAQAVDSIIFFPMAFGPYERMGEIALTGFVIKLVVSIPFIVLLILNHNARGFNSVSAEALRNRT
jgi:uncharacterized PurR-regulated membrane protein YhhQ (DUF165 family)